MVARTAMRKLLKRAGVVATVFLGLILLCGRLYAQTISRLQLTSKVSRDMISDEGHKTIIVAVDISHDASRLAILYGQSTDSNGRQIYKHLWVAIWDVQARKLQKSTELAESESESDVFTVGPLDVKFTADQRYLVILGLRRVWIINPSSFSPVTSIPPPRSDLGYPSQILLVSNSEVAVTYAPGSGGPFLTAIYRLPTGSDVTHWSSPSSPRSFSPNSQLAVISNSGHYNPGGVSDVVVIDSHTGNILKVLRTGFEFPKSLLGKRNGQGTVNVLFISDERVLAAPDGNRDSAGHHSGDKAEVINVTDGHVEQQIGLGSFGPTDTSVESIDRQWVALESIYGQPLWFGMESTNPSHFVHTLRLLKTDGSDSQCIVDWPSKQTDSAQLPALAISPRISSVGPTVVITEGQDIFVFASPK